MQKTITFTSNYGNFDYALSAEIGEDVNPATEFLCLQGMANLCYRAAGSNVDKALGAKDRKAVEYSEASGATIDAAVSKKLTELEAKTPALTSLKLSFQVMGEHEWSADGAAAGPGKQATLMAEMIAGTDAAVKFGGTKESSVEDLAGFIRAALAKVRKAKTPAASAAQGEAGA